MGLDYHHAIIVTGWSKDTTETARASALAIFGPARVSDLLTGNVNAWFTFAVGPDGSKEGWAESDRGDEQRAAFIERMEMPDLDGYLSWVEVQYGDRPARITKSSE